MSQALQIMRSQLHISHSQIFQYLTCSLKYWFTYVQREPGEHSSIALHFGKAIHSALEAYYLKLQKTGEKLVVEEIEQVFEDKYYQSLQLQQVPILYNKTTPDSASAVNLGKKMLSTYHTWATLNGCTIEAVELPLAATLYNHESEPMDIMLVGIIDLLLRDGKTNNLIVVDHKTAAAKKSQASVDDDMQMTAYSYLLASNKYVFPLAEVQGRLDVLRKLKTPKLETYTTTRGPDDRKRFARIAASVLAGIENDIFAPSSSWMCNDCQYSTLCKKW